MQRARRGRLCGQQVLIEAWLLPVARFAVRAEHAQVEACDRLADQFGQQRRTTGQLGLAGLKIGRLQDGRLHQRERHGGSGVEDFPFMRDVVADVLVARLYGELLLAAQYQYRGAVEYQWPQGSQFGFVQRVERLIGTYRRQNAQRVAFGMVQQRSAGHRQVGDAPGAQQVTEVNHALQLPLALAIAGPHGVVVGHVQVHGLAGQLVGQRRQVRSGQLGGLLDTGAVACVL
ncbi:hypothetical protein D3C80_1032490 [compost metagenome]